MVDELRELKVGHIRKQRDRDLLDRQLLVLHSVRSDHTHCVYICVQRNIIE